jgi:hypothetical protein
MDRCQENCSNPLVPLAGFEQILLHAVARVVGHAEVALGLGVAFFGRLDGGRAVVSGPSWLTQQSRRQKERRYCFKKGMRHFTKS